MSQSIAHLIKSKIFQGNTSSGHTSPEEERRRKGKKWGRRKNSDESDTRLWTRDGMAIQLPRSSLSPTRDENGANRNRIEDRIEEEDSGSESDTTGAEQTDEDGENSEEEFTKRGKLGILRSKMSKAEFGFKAPLLGHHQHGSYHDRQRSFEGSPKSICMSPSSFGARRSSHERTTSGIGSLYKLRSNSSASSLRFFSSPRRSGGNNAYGGDTNNRSQQFIRGHGRNGSVEMKSVKPQPISYGRRRSKTLNTYGGHEVKRNNTGELLSTINAHLSNCRCSSVKSGSPSLKNQESSVAGPISPPTPPVCRFSSTGTANGRVVAGSSYNGNGNTIGSIPFPAAPSEAQQVPALSRCGTSIANAFNSFVNLRSFSVTSSCKCTVNSKMELALPPPPAPGEGESPEDYLLRLSPYGREIGTILTETDDSFKKECLHYFLSHHFDFRNCPLDVAMRILLVFLKLPRESQQIDRLLIEFSKVYYKAQCCGSAESDIFWVDENQLYLLSFSLLMLHTDYFSPKNRFKMSKNEFIDLIHGDKESYGYKIPKEILSYFYDNITAKEFPKIDWTYHTSEPESDNDSPKIYSPLEVLKTRSLSSNSDFIPLAVTQTGRTSSNSFSSYLPHGPTSSSSSSLAQDDVDIYGHIFNNALSDLSLKPLVQKLWQNDYAFELFNDQNKYNKYFTIFKEAKGGYLRLHKNDLKKLSFPKYDVLNSLNSDLDFMYLKIIQMGEIEELTVNKKFSIVGSANKTMWKKQLGILTSCGLLLFENNDWIDPHLMRDECTGTSNYIIDYQPSTSVILESPLPAKGLLAVNKSYKLLRQALWKLDAIEDETESRSLLGNVSHVTDGHSNGDIDENCIMRLYGSQSGKILKCFSLYERDNWIDAINLMASCDGCMIDVGTIPNTVVSARKHDVKERMGKLLSTGREKRRNLKKLENILALYNQTMPICTRTKNELLFHVKQLAVTMEWLVYEIKRNEIDLRILEQLSLQFDMDGNEERDVEEDGGDKNKLIDDYRRSTMQQRMEFAQQSCMEAHTRKSTELVDKHMESATKQREQSSYKQAYMAANEALSSPSDQSVFDGELMQGGFRGDHDAVMCDQTEVSNGEMLTSY